MQNEKHESPEEIWGFYNRTLKRLRRQIDELKAENEALKAEKAQAQAQPAPQPAPLPKLPTAKMRKAVAQFDAMSDSDQVAALQEVWGE